MKLFLHIDPNTISESHTALPQKVQLDEIDALADTLEANMGKEVKVPKDVLDSFKIKDSLNSDIWINDSLNPEVRAKLIQVALDFFKDLELPEKVKIKDIIFTGSLANFNWSKFSDIDLHIVIDFNDFNADTQMVEDYFYAQKSIWNQEHDIKVFNYPIELYVQDINAKLIATAVYSVLKNKWLKKPTRENFKLDKTAIKQKAEAFIHSLRDIRQDYQDKNYQGVVDKVKRVKEKIKNMRNTGLEKGGEFSLENLVFKTLRRTPFMDILDSYKAKAYDNLMSVSETTEPIDMSIHEGEVLDNSKFKYVRENEDEITIRAIYEGEIIGTLSMAGMYNAYWYFQDEMFTEYKFMIIGYLEIKQRKYMGEGIAKELMTRAIRKAKQQGFNTIWLNASPMGTAGLGLNDLVAFYKKFGFEEMLHQGHNTQMIRKLNETLTEDNLWDRGGVILIKGAPLEDGSQRLYATTINNRMGLDRFKNDNSKGKAVTMAVLGNQVYRVSIVDGKLKAQGVAWSSEQKQLQYLGLKNFSVGINNNKTPLHWETLKFNNIAQALNTVGGQILNLPNIKWVG
jgi:GNAT superfamily N-acetyltransferase